jgi:hypothetical protein
VAASAQFYGSQPTSTNINGNVTQIVTQKVQAQNFMGNDMSGVQDAAVIHAGTSINGNVTQIVTQDIQGQNGMGNNIHLVQGAAGIGVPQH